MKPGLPWYKNQTRASQEKKTIDQNSTETPFLNKIGKKPKSLTAHCVDKAAGKQNSRKMLVEMQDGTTSMEGNFAILAKLHVHLPLIPVISLLQN